MGSGVAVPGGIVSSDRVVGDADRVVLVASNGRRSTANVVRRAPARDLVLLATDLALPPVDLELSTDQHPGQMVLVVGYPRPDTLGGTAVTLTHGLISALRHDQEGISYLQTDAPMDPGVAGGAMVNLRGHVVGIPSFSGDAGPWLTFAVAAEEVQTLLQQPSAPPADASSFTGDPQQLLPLPADLGPAWRAAPSEPGAPAQAHLRAGLAAATGRLVRGDPMASAGPFAELRSVVLVAPDAEHAQWEWERGLRHPPPEFVRLPDPSDGATCHVYQHAGQEGTDLQALCSESNVVIGVTLSGTPDVATADAAIHAAAAITRHVQDGED